jgi:hypothetical protein
MPKYRATKPGFIGGMLHGPNTKRPTVTVEKAFKECPEWLEPIKEASKNQRPAKGGKPAKGEDVSFMDAPAKPTTETL